MRPLHKRLASMWRLHRTARRTASFVSHLQRVTSKERSGLFGLQGLHQPEDWHQIADQCVSDCLSLAEKIRAPQHATVRILHIFDDLSDRLCSVLDAAELCRNVHPNAEFVEAANDAFLEVSKVTKLLNSDYTLYQPLHQLLDKYKNDRVYGGGESDFSAEDVVMVKSLTSDFERGGIRLGNEHKKQLLKLQGDVDSLGAQFLSHASTQPPILVLPSSILSKTPPRFRRALRLSATKANHFDVPVTSSNANMLLKWVPDSRVREKVFRMTHSDGEMERLAVLDGILDTRRQVATLLGRKSYAHLLFDDRVASTPDDVSKFLENLSRILRTQAQQEKHALEIEKLKRESNLGEQARVSVHGWDKSYYIGRLKARDYDLSSFEVSQYLPLSACLNGLAYILSEVFDMKLVKTTPNEGEVWHSDVEKYRLIAADGALMGEIFMDLYPRKGKYGHAAHFSIRCGRQPADENEYQTPVVALVCNFGHGDYRDARLLTISEYETLFHEFGHSLHSLFSRTKYQHLSGTRVPTDFVEIPSHLFEQFAWDPRIISRIARHHRTGDPMPTRLVKALVASRKGFVSTDVQTQILFSAMDLAFHGPNPPVGSTTEAFEALQNTLTVYPPDKGVPFPATFHHFVGYGAGYYSYIFARVISAQLWSNLFGEDPLSQRSGSILRSQILALGGARDPAVMLNDVLRGNVTCDSFLRSVGIHDTERKESLRLPLSRKPS